MAHGILGQASPAATTNTVVYTVPAATTSTVTINICNTGTSSIAVRLAVAASGTPLPAEWLEYDASIPASGVLERTGVIAQAGKNIVVYSSAATASVSVYGFEEA